eukprot:6174440-Pleurochrysis_carterae.AAC.1
MFGNRRPEFLEGDTGSRPTWWDQTMGFPRIIGHFFCGESGRSGRRAGARDSARARICFCAALGVFVVAYVHPSVYVHLCEHTSIRACGHLIQRVCPRVLVVAGVWTCVGARARALAPTALRRA